MSMTATATRITLRAKFLHSRYDTFQGTLQLDCGRCVHVEDARVMQPTHRRSTLTACTLTMARNCPLLLLTRCVQDKEGPSADVR